MATRGEKRHLVTLEGPIGAAVPDGDGGYTRAYVPLDPPMMRAKVEPATTRELERITAGTSLTTASHVVTMDYHAGVTTETRIGFKGRTLYVTGVSNPDERDRETIAVCQEVMS